ncbi:MAG TPA: hypothetical protein VID19_12800 [Candidatus Eremiobacteraceae bacterium]
MKRSHALDAVTAVERRMKAAVAAATGFAREVTGLRRRNRTAIGRAIQAFNSRGLRSAFACAAAQSHRTLLSNLDFVLADRMREADCRVQTARDAAIPWSQLRCGLERRRLRLAAKF